MLETLRQTLLTEFVFNFEFLNEHDILHEKLLKIWGSPKLTDYEIIIKSLKVLPEGYGVFFLHEGKDNIYVQFKKEEGNIILDFPLYVNKRIENNFETIVGILSLHDIRKITRYEKFVKRNYKRYFLTENKNGRVLQANLKRNYKLASELVFEMWEKAYRKKTPEFITCHVIEF